MTAIAGYDCGLEAALDVVGGKWKSLILWALAEHGTLRFGRLRREVSGVSEKMLVQQLRELERDGLIDRTIYPEVPPRVEYRLTALGEKLNAALTPLGDWGEAFIVEVLSRRQAALAAAGHNGARD